MLRLLAEIVLGWLEWKAGKAFARALWSGSGFMTESRLDDPIYKKNVQNLIERNRRLEESKE